jgi:hypothetical protein
MMLVVFLVGVAPKEYLHDVLYHHTDTVDPVYKKGEVVISAKHIHCSFLGFAFAPFVGTEQQYLSFEEVPFYTCYLPQLYQYHYSSSHRVVSLRGPPACNC